MKYGMQLFRERKYSLEHYSEVLENDYIASSALHVRKDQRAARTKPGWDTMGRYGTGWVSGRQGKDNSMGQSEREPVRYIYCTYHLMYEATGG